MAQPRRVWFVAFALAATGVGAAERGPEDTAAGLLVSDWKLGPFYVRPTFEVSNLGYSSNPFNQEEASSDLTGRLSPGFRLALPMGESLLRFAQSFSYQYFRDSADRRAWGAESELGLDLVLGAFKVDMTETFSRTDQPAGVETVTHADRLENRFALVVATPRDAGVYLESQLGHSWTRYDEAEVLAGTSLAEQYDRVTLTGDLAVFFDLLDAARPLVGGRYGRHDFSHGDSDRDADEIKLFGGFRFDPAYFIHGEVRAGYRRLELGQVAPPELRGFGYQLDLSFDLGDALLRLTSERTNSFSELAWHLFARADRHGVELRIPLVGRLALALDGKRHQLRYPIERSSSGFDGRYVFWQGGATWHIPLGEDFELLLGGTYRDLSSNSAFGYDGFALTTGFRYGQ